MKLKGKNALVTGAAKRIGRVIALALAREGMNIAVHYNHSKNEAISLVEEIVEMGCKALAVKADCSKKTDIHRAVDRVIGSFKKIDVLINNAAIFGPSKLFEIDDKEWDKYIDINLKAPFYFIQRMLKKNRIKQSKIINIADVYGVSPAAGFIPYGVSKSGVISMTKGLAKSLAPDILVNCICPGPILPSIGGDKKGDKRAVEATLLKRFGTPEDIAKTVLFLAENDYITGQAIFIDGGKSV